jgi:hypothetical protein
MSIIATNDLEVADSTTVELDDKNGNELLDAAGQGRRSITIYGPGSRQFAEAQAKHNARGLKRMRTRGGRVTANADEEIGAKASFLADITISFNGFGLSEEQQTRDAFREFYANTGVGYLTDQVNTAAGDWANF